MADLYKSTAQVASTLSLCSTQGGYMIDYHGHVAGLRVIQEALDASLGELPAAGAWQATKAAIAVEPGCALLGTLLDHLLERSQGAQPEHELLEEGAQLYQEAAGLLAKLAPLRKQFEV